ncbi:hypothetical protein N2152v2_002385 [Parachlorella kessleri]
MGPQGLALARQVSKPNARVGLAPRRLPHLVVVAGPDADFAPEVRQRGLQRQLEQGASQGTTSARDATKYKHRARSQQGSSGGPGWAFAPHSGDLTPDQLRSGLDRQLTHSEAAKARQPPASAEMHSAAARQAEADLKRRQKEARAWVTPWLEQQARKRSAETQALLMRSVDLMPAEVQQRALRRLLVESGSMDWEEGGEEEMGQEAQGLAVSAQDAPEEEGDGQGPGVGAAGAHQGVDVPPAGGWDGAQPLGA